MRGLTTAPAEPLPRQRMSFVDIQRDSAVAQTIMLLCFHCSCTLLLSLAGGPHALQFANLPERLPSASAGAQARCSVLCTAASSCRWSTCLCGSLIDERACRWHQVSPTTRSPRRRSVDDSLGLTMSELSIGAKQYNTQLSRAMQSWPCDHAATTPAALVVVGRPFMQFEACR